MEQVLDPRLHFVVATAIIVKQASFDATQDVARFAPEFLIAKRAPHEKAFPRTHLKNMLQAALREIFLLRKARRGSCALCTAPQEERCGARKWPQP